MKKSIPKNYEGIVYQVIRPTGLLDPIIDVRPIFQESFENLKRQILEYGYFDMLIAKLNKWEKSQISDLITEIEKNIRKNQRTLVLTLTKKMSEELSEFLQQKNLKSKYIHSEIDTIERVDILKDLRKGDYDVLVGINLLREGLDLPEVSLVAILDADKEGFLRSKTSLIQVIGRAARHVEGRVIMYADKITDSMKYAIDETRKRRSIQEEYNKKFNITPKSIQKEIIDQLEKFKDETIGKTNKQSDQQIEHYKKLAESYKAMSKKQKHTLLKEIKVQMQIYADMLEFEKAIELREILKDIEK